MFHADSHPVGGQETQVGTRSRANLPRIGGHVVRRSGLRHRLRTDQASLGGLLASNAVVERPEQTNVELLVRAVGLAPRAPASNS